MKIISSFSNRSRYGFLSNFFPCEIRYQGYRYKSVEHAFQAAKAVKNADRILIAAAGSPASAKRLGGKVERRKDWEDIKVSIMLKLLQRKFRQDPLKELLLKTDDAILIEGNTWDDRFWGMTRMLGDEWVGLNMLGILLMMVREGLGGGFDG